MGVYLRHGWLMGFVGIELGISCCFFGAIEGIKKTFRIHMVIYCDLWPKMGSKSTILWLMWDGYGGDTVEYIE